MSNEEKEAAVEEKRGQDPIKKITRIVLLVLVVYVGFYILADRKTPYTDQGRVQALVTPIVPRVAGHLTQIDVRLHSVVEEGDPMFVIDKRPYEVAVLQAEANLDLVGQQGMAGSIGARLTLIAGDKQQSREIHTASSFQSQSALTAHFGLGDANGADVLQIDWPDGASQKILGLQAGRRYSSIQTLRSTGIPENR